MGMSMTRVRVREGLVTEMEVVEVLVLLSGGSGGPVMEAARGRANVLLVLLRGPFIALT